MSGIKKITDEVKSAVAKSVEPMKNLTTQAKDMASKSASSVSQMKAQMKSYSGSIQETAKQQDYLRTKIEDLKDLLAKADMGFEVGDTMKIEADIERLENRLRKLQSQGQNTGKETSSAFDKIKAKVKSAGTHLAGLGGKFKNVLSGSKNLGKTFTSTFNNGIKSIKRFAMGLLSVRTAVSMVSKAMQSYLSYDTQLSNSIQNCWNVLGSLLAPILEFVISLFSKAVSYVNAFVEALTGINLVARANKKALDSQAKSTKKLSDTQSSLDEFHTVSTDTGSGNDNKPITVEPVDMDKLDFLFDWIDKAKKLLATLFDPIKEAWDNKGKAFIDSLKNAFEGIKSLGIAVFSSIFEVWTNGTGQKIVENILEMWTNVFNIVGALSQALANAWNNAGNGTAIIQAIADIFIGIQDIVNSIANSLLNWVMSDNFQSALNVVLGILADLFGYAQEIMAWVVTMYETYLAPVVDKVLDCISRIIIAIGSVWEFLKPIIDTIIDVIMNVLEPVIDGLCGIIGGIIDALSGVMDFITGVFTGDWSKAWEGLKTFLGGIIDAVASLFTGLFNTIRAIFKGAWDIIVSIWSVVSTWFNNAVIKPLANLFNGIWNTMKNGAQNAWNGIKNIFSSVATFFKNIFGNAWNGVKNIFSSGGRIFSGIKDGIFNAFRSVVNTLIAGINKVVSIPFNAINGALKTVRDISFLGIEPFKGLIKLVNVPQIPSLETGGVLDKETIVRVAEYSNARSNPEIVSPRDMMKETMKEALEESNMNNTSQKVDVNITGKLTADGDDLVYVYDKNKKDKGYDGGKNPSFAY
jgi:phage-related protein